MSERATRTLRIERTFDDMQLANELQSVQGVLFVRPIKLDDDLHRHHGP